MLMGSNCQSGMGMGCFSISAMMIHYLTVNAMIIGVNSSLTWPFEMKAYNLVTKTCINFYPNMFFDMPTCPYLDHKTPNPLSCWC